MPAPNILEQISIIRRIAERALVQAQNTESQMIDIIQHLIDEIYRIDKELNNGIRCEPTEGERYIFYAFGSRLPNQVSKS